MRDVSMGQYYPASSVVHRADPRFKLVILILYLVTVFFCDSFFSFGFMTFFVLVTIFLSRVPILKVLKSLRFVIVILLFTTLLMMIFYSDTSGAAPLAEWGIFHIYLNGIYSAIKLGWRLMLLVLMPTVLTLTSTPTELCDGLESLLSPLKLLHIPVHVFALIMSIALSLIPSLIEETDKIINAQRSRGAAFESRNPFKKIKAMIPVLIPLFVSSFRRADELADAMDSRCYRGAKGRTRMKKLKAKLSDFVALLFWCAITVCILFLNYNWCGWAFITALGI
ncbi:MAG: energy-coupling factor transporter transmembrane protein EcfT [Clostridiales bacterium]|nr:energy-coupling factor transporter transmembrane protein EcfT [Clostridiales bacterium]